ncbi:hypothetical protein FQN54_005160 [Arachnomyces sp. PD_36]|nr:hypothetical protein FQN54_005160 [Arachnomyces sp. PD_36]
MEPTSQSPEQNVPPTVTQGSSQSPAPKKYSCVVCQQRKVKCDRQYPCSACERGRATCIYRAPAPPRRRKGRRELGQSAANEVTLIARLRRYEELLKRAGVRLDERDASEGVGALNIHDEASATSRTGEVGRQDHERQTIFDRRQGMGVEGNNSGKLISGDGKSRFFENHMWASLSDEFQDSKDILQSSSEDEDDGTPYGVPDLDGADLIFGSPSQSMILRSFHPPPIYMSRYWQIFLDNFDPLVRILHIPTLRPSVIEAVGNLENLSKPMEALLFAIYSAAVTTLSSAECESMTGEPKSTLIARYHAATKLALINAGFLKSSDLLLLKAYVIFLLSVRSVQDPRSLWPLTGIAVRIGQRLGLHRDGEAMNISLFETEMRRRLWWQIIVLDTRTAELSGCGASVLAHLWDTKIPLNVNDTDLHPQMNEYPAEHAGPTDMMFCMLRYQVGEFFRKTSATSVLGGSWHSLSDPRATTAEKDKAIDDIEQMMEDKFLKYCDPAVPLHFITSIVARSAVCKMRVLAHHPSKRPGGEESMPVSEVNLLFTNSLKTIEYDNLAQSSRSISRFMWHVDVHFQWLSFIYLLSQLRSRTSGEEADRAWREVGETFHNRPEIISDAKNALHQAVRNLTIKAWEARMAASGATAQCYEQGNQPKFISLLYARRAAMNDASTAVRPRASAPPNNQPSAFVGQWGHNTISEPSPSFQQHHMPVSTYPAGTTFELVSTDDVAPLPNGFSPMDWAQWNDLIRDHEL